MLSEDVASEALEKRGSDSVACELGGLGGSGSERIGSVSSCNFLLSFFLHVSQIFEPIEICGALSHIQAVTARSEVLSTAAPGMTRYVKGIATGLSHVDYV